MALDRRRTELLQSIATTIADYRQSEISIITPDNVNKWVYQFDSDQQMIILEEMDHLLRRCYVSRQKAKDFIISLLRYLFSNQEYGSEAATILSNIQFLQIQRKGSSQSELLCLVNQVLQEEYNLSLEASGRSPRIYIYLDDCLFSGNTAFYDLKDRWLTNASDNTDLILVFFAYYTEGYSYNIEKRLKTEIRNSGKAIKVNLLYDDEYIFYNSRRRPGNFNCLWTLEFQGSELVDKYINELRARRNDMTVFRPLTDNEETFFSSSANRRILEYAFMKAGAYIISLSDKPKPQMRPLGYEVLESIGFGATFVTYRNIANNCPLALWWGDPNYPKTHPLGNWYPLFPRKTNE